MHNLDLGQVASLYRKYATELQVVGDLQRDLLGDTQSQISPQLDDVEAEITYMLVRELRPTTVVEFGTFDGWSTSWLLRAIRENRNGHLYSFDLVDNVTRNIPKHLAGNQWTFHHGDLRTKLSDLPPDIDYLFIDASHAGGFATWYLAHIFPILPEATMVSVHDVYHFRYTLPFHEGRKVVRWLKSRKQEFFTPSRARSPQVYNTVNSLRSELSIPDVRGPGDNPMIYFLIPARPHE